MAEAMGHAPCAPTLKRWRPRDFTRKPTVGVNDDNIYTIQTGDSLVDSLIGRRPDNRLGPLSDTDSVIVP